MSTVAIPTKTAGQRPPVVPPIGTTFDGTPPNDGESYLVWLSNDVRRTIRHVDAAGLDDLDREMKAIDQRRQWVIAYLDIERMFAPTSVPPVEGLSIDYFLERKSAEETTLVSLLSLLDECKERSERRLQRYEAQLRLSRELGASDS